MAGGGIGCHGLVGHGRPGSEHHGQHPDGRRGRALDRHRAIHRGGPLLPEPRRRHLRPLRVAALRQAAAAGSHITFKILYNSAVAMTGGQDAAGPMPVPRLARGSWPRASAGVIVTTDRQVSRPSGSKLPSGVEVWHRSQAHRGPGLLKDESGVTVLVYDQQCAAEKRRDRKRGKVDDPALRIVINERVCEGCGDCGVKSSNCLSVQPIDTEFGRKTQIHQSSCNKDYTCIEGDCPARSVGHPGSEGGGEAPGRAPPTTVIARASRPHRADRRCHHPHAGHRWHRCGHRLPDTGHRGPLDGRYVDGLDQTGLSQKGGRWSPTCASPPEPTGGGANGRPPARPTLPRLRPPGRVDPGNLAGPSPSEPSPWPPGQSPDRADGARHQRRVPRPRPIQDALDGQPWPTDNLYLDAVNVPRACSASRTIGQHLARGGLPDGCCRSRPMPSSRPSS